MNPILPRYPNYGLFNELERIRDVSRQLGYEVVKAGKVEANIHQIEQDDNDRAFNDGLVLLRIAGNYGALAQDLKTAKELVAAHAAKDQRRIGEMIGCPDCCIDFIDKAKTEDPIYEIAINSGEVGRGGVVEVSDYNPLLRKDLRYFRILVTPWFPCSFSCSESSRRAKDWLEVLEKIDSSLAKRMIELMSAETHWSLSNRQILVDHKDFKGYCQGPEGPRKDVIFGGLK